MPSIFAALTPTMSSLNNVGINQTGLVLVSWIITSTWCCLCQSFCLQYLFFNFDWNNFCSFFFFFSCSFFWSTSHVISIIPYSFLPWQWIPSLPLTACFYSLGSALLYWEIVRNCKVHLHLIHHIIITSLTKCLEHSKCPTVQLNWWSQIMGWDLNGLKY